MKRLANNSKIKDYGRVFGNKTKKREFYKSNTSGYRWIRLIRPGPIGLVVNYDRFGDYLDWSTNLFGNSTISELGNMLKNPLQIQD